MFINKCPKCKIMFNVMTRAVHFLQRKETVTKDICGVEESALATSRNIIMAVYNYTSNKKFLYVFNIRSHGIFCVEVIQLRIQSVRCLSLKIISVVKFLEVNSHRDISSIYVLRPKKGYSIKCRDAFYFVFN
jgi:hypothetical protein